MIINLSETASNGVLDTLAAMMDGGSIELLSRSGYALAVLKLSSPAAKAATGGELEFNTISEGTAATGGRVETARIVAADGNEVFSCDVGDENSDAVIRLAGTTQIYRGQLVRIGSFKLAMP